MSGVLVRARRDTLVAPCAARGDFPPFLAWSGLRTHAPHGGWRAFLMTCARLNSRTLRRRRGTEPRISRLSAGVLVGLLSAACSLDSEPTRPTLSPSVVSHAATSTTRPASTWTANREARRRAEGYIGRKCIRLAPEASRHAGRRRHPRHAQGRRDRHSWWQRHRHRSARRQMGGQDLHRRRRRASGPLHVAGRRHAKATSG